MLSHGTADTDEPELPSARPTTTAPRSATGRPVHARSILALFDGLDLVEPGLVPVNRWRPDGKGPELPDDKALIYAGVARKP